MTDLDLDRLEALAEKATPSGDWIVTELGQCCNGSCMTDIDGDGPIHDSDARYADLAFIAALRNAAPALLAAARAVQRVEAALDLLASDTPGEMLVLPAEHHACEREITRLVVVALRAALGGAE